MNTFKAYKNYGCLASEKRVRYTAEMPAGNAIVSDECILKAPNGWNICESMAGFLLVESPWGQAYRVNDILKGNNRPCFIAWNGAKYVKAYLSEVE